MPTSKKTKLKPWIYPLDTPFDDMQYRKMYLKYRLKLYNLYKQADMAGVMEASQDVPVALQDIYVPLRLATNEITNISNSNEVNKIKGMPVEEALCQNMLVAISGMPGSGKSTLTRFISDSLSQTEVNPTAKKLGRRIVIPVVLRDLNFSTIDSLEQLWEQWVSDMSKRLELNLTWDFFWYYIIKGWAIIIFDGIDELSIEKNKKLTFWINELTDKIFNKLNDKENKNYRINIIVTGRPSGFTDNDTLKNFIKLHLQPFNKNEIDEYSKKWFNVRYRYDKVKIQEKTNEFIEALRRYKGLAEFKHRPIYLAMLAYVAETFGELPRSRTLAYSKMVDAYIHQLELIKQLNEKKGFPEQNWSYEDKLRILEELAYSIHTQADNVNLKPTIVQSQMHIQISKESLVDFITAILRAGRFDSIKNEDAFAFSQYLLARTGLLIEPKEGYIQFSHLTFQEFLTAKRIHRRQKRTNLIKYLKEELFDKLSRTGWHEISLLFFGIDALNAGEDQSYVLRHVIEPYNNNQHGFLIDLFATTDHTISSDSVTEWLKTIIYLWVTNENPPAHLFNYLKQSLSPTHSINKKEINSNILKYIEYLGDRILYNQKIYDDNNLIKSEDDDDTTSLANHLESFSNNVRHIICLQNILRIGFQWSTFRSSYLTNDRINKIPENMRNEYIPFILDDYIPFNISNAEKISDKVFSNIDITLFSKKIGCGIEYELLYNTNKIHKEILRIILTINSGLLFLINKTVDSKIDISNSFLLSNTKDNKFSNIDLEMLNFGHFFNSTPFNNSLLIDFDITVPNILGSDMIRNLSYLRYTFNHICNLFKDDNEIKNDHFNHMKWLSEKMVRITKDVSSYENNKLCNLNSDIINSLININFSSCKNIKSRNDVRYIIFYNFILNFIFFLSHNVSLCISSDLNINIDYSKNKLIEMSNLISSNNIINNFISIDNEINNVRKKEILSWMNMKSSPRNILNHILLNSKYTEYHPELVNNDFYVSIENFSKICI